MAKSNKDIQVPATRSRKWLWIIIFANLAGLAGLFTWTLSAREKTGYVDLGQVFSEFEMAKEKEKEIQSMSFSYKNTLDSLALELQSLESQYSSSPSKELEMAIGRKNMNYLDLEEKMQNSLAEFKAEADNQVWSQINAYVKEYGDQKGYEYIYGGNGTGSMMYAKETRNITGDVIVFINKKYAGE